MSTVTRVQRWRNEFRDYAVQTPKSDLPARARNVGSWLGTYMDAATLTCWPSLRTLAAVSGLTPDTVIEAIRDLEAHGIIAVTPGQGGSKHPNRYRGRLGFSAEERSSQSNIPGESNVRLSTETRSSQSNRTRTYGSEQGAPSGEAPDGASPPADRESAIRARIAELIAGQFGADGKTFTRAYVAAFAELRESWPAEVPTPKLNLRWTDNDMDRIESVLTQAERHIT